MGCDVHLEVNIKEKSKLVEIWLTNEEKRDLQLREKLKPLYKQYKSHNYLVVVYFSGEQDLASETSALLCYNRKSLAQHEVRQDLQQGSRREEK